MFDHNMALIARGMDKTWDGDVDYAKSLGHKIGMEFVSVAKTMLTPRNKGILHDLQDFAFSHHKSYNLPVKCLRFLSSLVRSQIHDILS